MDKIATVIIRFLLKLCFRVEVRGLENYYKCGKRVLILPNHQSFLDPPLLCAFLPEKPNFAINTQIAGLWFVKPWLFMLNVFRTDPTNPMSMKALIEFVRQDKKIVIFPEGRITVTGSLMKVYEGPGLVADKSCAEILPVRIEGAQYTIFSRMKGKVRRRLFPKITLTIMPPIRLEVPAGKDKRQYYAQAIERMMSETMFAAADYQKPLLASLMEVKKIHGGGKIVAEEIGRKKMKIKTLILKMIILGNVLKPRIAEQNVGVLMPNSLASVVLFFALQFLGKTPAMLNFTSGVSNIKSACVTVKLQTIITSRAFIEKAELGEIVAALADKNIIYLEDVAKEISPAQKAKGALKAAFLRKPPAIDANSPAVILFTSGTEGAPKAVLLSHANIQSNIGQAESVIDFSSQDVLLNVLPMFHSFGLTVGTILPITRGAKVFLYPSPLHYHIIPELAYAAQATYLFGTDTFLAKYGKFAHPYDFFKIRYVLAGAEKLKESTYQLWQDKFGIRIMQGYGVTETSPYISCNTALQNRKNSVGKIAPGIEHKLVPVEGIQEGGELWVKGPNIMMGYMKHDNPGVLQPPQDGWYATGDIVKFDEDGFVFILGRAKRFAKIAGEMVSLPMIEDFFAKIWPENTAVLVAIKDERKGEQIVLVTDKKDASANEISRAFAEAGLPSIAIPKQILNIEIPLLGSGKTDYRTLQTKVEESVIG